MNELTINVSKEYHCSAKVLFKAVSEGILFKYTGALMEKLQMDFREGGLLSIDWGDSLMNGEFKVIKPYEKIVLTWNSYSSELKTEINSLVTITIQDRNNKAILNLVHEGIGSEKEKADMLFGWTDAIEDMYKSYFKF